MSEPLFQPIDLGVLPPEDLDRAGDVLKQLSRYARVKAKALRSDGEESRAHDLECLRIYRDLPKWARW